jgi:hypothetical protein
MDSKIFPIRPGIQLAETPTIQRMVDQKGGKAGIEQTLKYMRDLKNAYKINPVVRGLAMSLVAQLPQKDYKSEILILTAYVKNQVRYTRDIAGVETLQTPLKTLEFGQGDCDDKSMLLAAMLESIGHHCRFRAVGMKKNDFCHVFPEVMYQGKWLALETTEPVSVGWEPPGIVENMTDDSSSIDGLTDKVKGVFHKSVTLSRNLAVHPQNIADNVKTGASIVANTPGVDKILKIKGLSTILTVVGWLYPPLGAAMTYIGYALDIAKAATALDGKIQAAKAAKSQTLADGTSVYEAEQNYLRLKKEAERAAEIGNRIVDIDRASNLIIYSSVIALGTGAYYLHKRKVF